jgi:plastocyanin
VGLRRFGPLGGVSGVGAAAACLAFFSALLSAACGSSGGDVLYIDAPAAAIKVGERISLSALATEVLAAPPEWDVQELEGGSLVRASGMQTTYLAPPLAGTYHIVARATRANGQRVRAVQVMSVQPAVSVEPASVRLAPGDSCAFAARVRGLRDPRVAWAVEEPDGGQVTQGGAYTAPAAPGYYQVTATVQADGQPSATATVRVEQYSKFPLD